VTAQVGTTWSADGTRLRIVLQNPKGNILTHDMVRGLREVVRGLGGAHALRLVTLEGDGANFSFGASVAEHAPGRIDRVLPDTHRLLVELLDAPAPTAALVRGRCLGGGFELALACDFIFASDEAAFGLPEIALGVYPPAGSVLLPLRVGASRAAVAVLTGESRPASYWHALGLVEIVAPAVELQAAVDRWYDARLAPHSAAALRHAARAARQVLREEVARTLPELERRYLGELMSTRDATEGITAFLEKRPPQWQDQ
jgi:cyclohexa-1,5-dienecarbonyl-CoA hydratase